MRSGDIVEITIDSIAFGGSGVGRYIDPAGEPGKGFAIFVEDTAPGDRVRARIGAKKRTYAFAYVEEFLEKAPERVAPRCKHFGICGGCSMQFLPYEEQLKIKEQQVRDAIKRIGGIDDSVVRPIIGCENDWYYRNKMDFSFSRSKEGTFCLGLHVRRRHHDVTKLEECFLQESYIGPLVTRVRNFFREMDSAKRIGGDMKPLSLVVRQGKHTGETMLNLIFENGEPDFEKEFVQMAEDFFGGELFEGELSNQKLTSIYCTNIINKKGSPKVTTEKLWWGEPVIHERLKLENGKSLKFEISPQAFFQPNTFQAEVLYSKTLEAADLTGKEVVYDLFCGAGTIGSFCAHAAKKVYGIEMNESAVKNARANVALNGIDNIEFIAGDVAKVLGGESSLEKPDVIIVDPPRGGLDPKAVELVGSLKAPRIIYVSCNPTTLARDLQLFIKTGYTLLQVQPVDMFPQTYHIENVATLKL